MGFGINGLALGGSAWGFGHSVIMRRVDGRAKLWLPSSSRHESPRLGRAPEMGAGARVRDLFPDPRAPNIPRRGGRWCVFPSGGYRNQRGEGELSTDLTDLST